MSRFFKDDEIKNDAASEVIKRVETLNETVHKAAAINKKPYNLEAAETMQKLCNSFKQKPANELKNEDPTPEEFSPGYP